MTDSNTTSNAIRRPLFVANWKMNKLVAELPDFVGRLKSGLGELSHDVGTKLDIVLCPSPAHLSPLARCLEGAPFELGAQNCGAARFGAFTGEVSPLMLKELGCLWVIVGHSERRQIFHEDSTLCANRARAAVEEGLKVIFCVGETLEERRRGATVDVVRKQLVAAAEALEAPSWSDIVVAYEPVWAIGTGETATPAQAQEVHHFIRGWLAEIAGRGVAASSRLLYGGSVKPENASQLLEQPDVDGFLVGTASLDPVVFAGVIRNGLGERK